MSRYEHLSIRRRNGIPTLDVREINRYVPENSTVHTVVTGDTLDHLAYRYYGDPEYWWVIADKNPEMIFDTVELKQGSRIVIPPLRPVLLQYRGRTR